MGIGLSRPAERLASAARRYGKLIAGGGVQGMTSVPSGAAV